MAWWCEVLKLIMWEGKDHHIHMWCLQSICSIIGDIAHKRQ